MVYFSLCAESRALLLPFSLKMLPAKEESASRTLHSVLRAGIWGQTRFLHLQPHK